MGAHSRGGLAEAAATADVLDTVSGLRRRTRLVRQGAGWFPLAMVGLVLAGSDPISRLDSGVADLPIDGGFRTPTDHWFANIAGWPPNVPMSIYWVLAIPAAFVLSGLWLRWRAARAGIAQPWVSLTLLGLLPFAALVLTRLVLEPAIPSVHAVLSQETPSKWLNPVFFLGFGLLAIGVVERSRPILAVCVGVVAANAAEWIMFAGNLRPGSWRYRLGMGILRPLGRHGLSLIGLSGVVLLLAAFGWLAYTSIGARTKPAP